MRKKQRLYIVLLAMLLLGGATALVMWAMTDSLVYFYGPTELVTRKDITPERRLRIGGLVEQGSVQKDGKTVRFKVTDTTNALPVVYTGLLPDLFREGQGVVAEGRLGRDGVFQASEVLAKHDEKYMPKEVQDALKQQGHWQKQYESK
jgi:cytochrome c-type biogenesis protein CcmE